jgi:hypothetical protein
MSTLKVSTLQNLSGTEVYTCKAWVNFNGTGTVAIRGSGNVSSITDVGLGQYTVNFTTTMPDANYSVTVTSFRTISWADGGDEANTYNAGNVRIVHVENGALADSSAMNVSVFR